MMRLTVSTFPNAKALPLWLSVASGLDRRHGLDLRLHETGDSDEQRAALIAGDVQIVQAAVDNAAELRAQGHDVVVFMGGERGMNDLVAQDGITTLSDLAGRRLAVDSPDTAYALLEGKHLRSNGLGGEGRTS